MRNLELCLEAGAFARGLPPILLGPSPICGRFCTLARRADSEILKLLQQRRLRLGRGENRACRPGIARTSGLVTPVRDSISALCREVTVARRPATHALVAEARGGPGLSFISGGVVRPPTGGGRVRISGVIAVRGRLVLVRGVLVSIRACLVSGRGRLVGVG
jgi:hypothetical protein